ncbi:hypothetical protein [Pantoea sp. 1.19]|uniref:hypothetical protein n=1 Tax=Pantoea sp. 1.19 TaxID=1925589 RepID=UPI00147B62D6|nr:hypothetical protein [Pantoea sp. 1.19]
MHQEVFRLIGAATRQLLAEGGALSDESIISSVQSLGRFEDERLVEFTLMALKSSLYSR